MRILMVVDHKIPTDIRIENEAEILVKNGHQVGILSIGDYSESETVQHNGYTIYRVAMRKSLLKKMHGLAGMIPWMAWKIDKHISMILKAEKYDTIHLHDLYTFGVIERLKRKFNLFYIGDMHENYVEVLKDYDWPNRFPNNLIVSHKKWERLEQKWLKNCDKVITVSEGIRSRLVDKGVKEYDAILTPNSIRLDLFDSYPINESIIEKFKDNYVLLYVGGFIGNRGLEHVVKAIPLLSQKIENVKLVLVGDGEQGEKLRSLVRDLKIEEFVAFEGWRDQIEIKSYLMAADVGLVPFKKTPQTDNSSSNKLFQYMYYKLPIAATNCNSVQMLVEAEECGIIYESENKEQLVESILALYSDADKSSLMGDKGYKAVVEKYNWDIASKQMVEMYDQLEKLKLSQ